MEKIKINVYDADMKKVKKTCEAELVAIPFGVVRKLMKLFKVDEAQDASDIMAIVLESWDALVVILGKIFPDMTDEDWDTVNVKELVTALYKLLGYALKDIMAIPTDSKNA